MKFCTLLVSVVLSFGLAFPVAQGQEIVPMPEPQEKPKLNIELRWVTMELKDDEELPQPITDLIQEVAPSQVKVVGGVPFTEKQDNDQTYTAFPTNGISFDDMDSHLFVQIDESQLNSIIDKAKENVRNSVTHAPVVTMYPGASAQVTDACWKPFVTSLQEVKGNSGTSYKPETNLFFEGTAVHIITSELTGQKINLHLNTKTTQIKHVSTVALGKSDENGNLKIQCPETESQSTNLMIPFEIGRSALVVLGTRERELRVENGIPIPGLNKVFRNTTTEKFRTTNLLLISVKSAGG